VKQTVSGAALGSAAEFAAFVRDDVARWAPIVKASGARME
jgi:tripartite-type tricarboxylate transporter receptor subunit TctC